MGDLQVDRSRYYLVIFMTTIELHTVFNAPIERCFNLSRSIDLHMESTKHTNEKAIAGKTSGLIEQGESVTWRAKHFLITQYMTVKITKMNSPVYFRDEMLSGPFRCMHHDHWFTPTDDNVLMKDRFSYEVPYGVAGWLFDKLILRKHMTALLKQRNTTIKAAAEAGVASKFLNE
jgi:ligand-binding SRPBCC domain-containing protein